MCMSTVLQLVLHLLVLDSRGRVQPAEANAVAPCALGGVAGIVGGTQQIGRSGGPGGDRNDADTDAEREGLFLPRVWCAFNRPLEAARDFFRLGHRTVFQEGAEFVAAEPPDRVAAAQAALQQPANRAEDVVPGLVTAGIVHDLESVEVQVAQGVLPRARRDLG